MSKFCSSKRSLTESAIDESRSIDRKMNMVENGRNPFEEHDETNPFAEDDEVSYIFIKYVHTFTWYVK